jgi:hypothetical protein
MVCGLDCYAEKPVEITPPLRELIAADWQGPSTNGLLLGVSVESPGILLEKL